MVRDEQRPLSRADAALLGAAVIGGWVLHDLAVFLSYGWPASALGLVPRSLALVLAGALLGWLAPGRPKLLIGAIVVAGGAAALLWRKDFGLPPLPRRLPHVGTLLFLSLGAGLACLRIGRARSGSAGSGTGPISLGLALGSVACVLFTSRFQALAEVSWTFLAAAFVALACFAFSRRIPARPVVLLLAVALPIGWVGHRVSVFGTLLRADLEPPSASAARETPNLLLIVLDTVRADRLSPYGYERATMPELDAFAAEHMTRYTNARSTSSWTLPSHASLFTGLLPARHGITHPRTSADADILVAAGYSAYPLREGIPTIAGRLRAIGFRTGAILSNSSTLRPRSGLAEGFEHYDTIRACFVRGYIALAQFAGTPLWLGHKPYRDATTITDLALNWIDEERDEPFFLALNYMDAHLPYLPPPPFDSEFADVMPRDPLAPKKDMHGLLYDRELRYLDTEVARLLREIQTRALFDNTFIVITSDHGEAFGDHGHWKHDWLLYEELIRVPLFVKPLGGRIEPIVEEPINGAEVHDLMLRGLGLEQSGEATEVASEWYYFGALPMHSDPPRTREELSRDLVAWVEGERKFIVSSTGEVEIFELAADPAELAPIIPTDAERKAAFERASAWWAANPPPSESIESRLGASGLDPDVADRLRNLGYLGQ